MFEDVGGFNFTIPDPPEPDRFSADQSQAEFQEWVNQAIDDFEREVDEIRRQFFQEVADITRAWEAELEEILFDERDNAEFPVPVVGPADIPRGYKLRNTRYPGADDVSTFISEIGLVGYAVVIVRLSSGLFTFAVGGSVK